jgi:hypothetical protein
VGTTHPGPVVDSFDICSVFETRDTGPRYHPHIPSAHGASDRNSGETPIHGITRINIGDSHFVVRLTLSVYLIPILAKTIETSPSFGQQAAAKGVSPINRPVLKHKWGIHVKPEPVRSVRHSKDSRIVEMGPEHTVAPEYPVFVREIDIASRIHLPLI